MSPHPSWSVNPLPSHTARSLETQPSLNPSPRPPPRILVCDACVAGWCRWARRRIMALGFSLELPEWAWRHDHILAGYAEKRRAILVTADERLAHRYPCSVLLLHPEGKRWFYEEWWTAFARGLSRLRRRCPTRLGENPF